MEDPKKRAAIATAVLSYIQTEEEAAVRALVDRAVEAMQPPAPQMPAGPANLWGLSGRQAQMQIRNMMQMRVYR